ncbi:hypothetical protein K461DRAFT_54078 [Myriangium duriaei CBS 260.36]|uniref:2EXR domain-containing protein n=1 Tax=Myriangium duriaei CBS 260.36 TaxID=1168546 RepID=A0A9P4MIJ7_9PEZI|nr:hypothetical protein K461DRAFT_54078 [Myriangium duriaei CBS 260.36]
MAPSNIPASLSSFTPFTKLPLELRNEIWRYIMPGPVGKILFKYENLDVHWEVRAATGSDIIPHVHRGGGDVTVFLDFSLAPRKEIFFDLPAADVNHEARAEARAWARLYNFFEESLVDDDRPTFVQRFDPQRHVFYIDDPEDLNDFARSFHNKVSGQGPSGDKSYTAISELASFAIKMELLYHGHLVSSGDEVAEIVHHHASLNTLFLILDETKTDGYLTSDMDWRLEVDPASVAGLYEWQPDENRFRYRQSTLSGDPCEKPEWFSYIVSHAEDVGEEHDLGDAFFDLLGYLDDKLAGVLTWRGAQVFTVCPVYANPKPNGIVLPLRNRTFR